MERRRLALPPTKSGTLLDNADVGPWVTRIQVMWSSASAYAGYATGVGTWSCPGPVARHLPVACLGVGTWSHVSTGYARGCGPGAAGLSCVCPSTDAPWTTRGQCGALHSFYCP
jgi:hypothetical protein